MSQFLCDDIVKTKEFQRVGTIVTVREDKDFDRYLVEFDRNFATRTFFGEDELLLISRPDANAPSGV